MSGAGFPVLVAAVVVRVVAVAVLVFGPVGDDPADLRGWDVERFQAIVDEPGRPYVDHEVEYPPGSLLVVQALDTGDVTVLHDRLAVVGLILDLGIAGLLLAAAGRRVATVYLVAGLALLPGTYQRLDVLAVLLAVAAFLAATARPERAGPAGVLLAAGFLVKTWPPLLAVALLAGRRVRSVVAGAACSVAGLAAWVAVAGGDAVRQVVAFRGATGWHVESSVGLVTGLWTGADAVREAGSYRLGAADGRVTALLGVVLVAILVAGLAAGLTSRLTPAAVALVSIAALLALAPLLSPQFLLWLLPFAALAWGDEPAAARCAVAAVVATGAVLAVWSPPSLDEPLPQVLLLGRNALLVSAALGPLWRLRRRATASGAGVRPRPAPAPGG